jgi:DNA primase
MKFPPAFLDEIRARLPVWEVVGARVKLRKAGREWAALSPFTSEKTPSFFVNDQKGFLTPRAESTATSSSSCRARKR